MMEQTTTMQSTANLHQEPTVVSRGRGRVHWRQVLLALMLLLLGMGPIFISVGDHPLYGRSDARYAEASREMLEGGDWLLPRLLDRPHLTKPPLAYWLEAGCMKMLGENELAVRLPSVVAGALSLVLVLVVGWQWRNWRVGVMAAGVLAVMPLAFVVARLPLTDSPLNLFWLATLACGLFAVRRPQQKRWAVLFCLAMAGAWMVKGPLALLPLGVLLLWLGLAGQWRAMGRLQLWWTLPLAVAPVAVWAVLVIVHRPGVLEIWYQETFARVVGEGDHPQPMWYFLPIFLGGLFPATAMMELPGLNLRWKAAWASLRQATDGALWALAVVAPLLFFSLGSGKLATYILPCAPPLALLTAVMLDRWLSGRNDGAPEQGYKPPEVVGTVTICLGLTWLGAMGAGGWFLGVHGVLMGLPLAVAPVAAAWLWWVWKKRPGKRGVGLMVLFVALIGTMGYVEELEDVLLDGHSIRSAVRQIEAMDEPADATWWTVGKLEFAFSFYRKAVVPVASESQLAAIAGVKLPDADGKPGKTPAGAAAQLPPLPGLLICYPDKLAVLQSCYTGWPGPGYRLLGKVAYNPQKEPLVVYGRVEPQTGTDEP